MKIDWNKKYTTIAVYSFIVIALSIIFYVILSGIDRFNQVLSGYFSVLHPFIYGFVIAYLINYPLNFFTKYLKRIPFFKKVKKSRIHILALILAYLFSGCLIYLFITFVLPQLVNSITGLARRIPEYISSTTDFIENLSNEVSIPAEVIDFINEQLYERWTELAELINEITTDLIPTVLFFLRNTAQSFINLFLGLIISTYMLAEKDRFISIAKKINYSIFNKRVSYNLIKISRRSHNIFSNFLGGRILDSAIIGLIAFVVLSIVKMPYASLVSFIIAVTNVVPFFGPFIGAVPSFLIILFESPVKALWFLVIIIILQQIDGNIIGPKILGDSMGISPFWILFSVIVSGRVFGFFGLIIGVPLFVLFYSIVKNIIEQRLKTKGLPIETEDYFHK